MDQIAVVRHFDFLFIVHLWKVSISKSRSIFEIELTKDGH